MGKKNKGGGILGKALIRDRFGASKGRKNVGEASTVNLSKIHNLKDHK